MDSTKKIESIESEALSPLELPEGCPFQNRCEYCVQKCKTENSVLIVGPYTRPLCTVQREGGNF